MRHFALHFAKYVGRLAEQDLKPEARTELLKTTCVDTFIIVLAASDVLNIDLDAEAKSHFGEAREPGLAGIIESVGDFESAPEPAALQEWWFHTLALPTGRIAKAVESLDHIEGINAREVIADGLLEILESVFIVARNTGLPLVDATDARWREIGSKRVV